MTLCCPIYLNRDLHRRRLSAQIYKRPILTTKSVLQPHSLRGVTVKYTSFFPNLKENLRRYESIYRLVLICVDENTGSGHSTRAGDFRKGCQWSPFLFCVFVVCLLVVTFLLPVIVLSMPYIFFINLSWCIVFSVRKIHSINPLLTIFI
jgi:hypothetical protein